MGYAEVFSYLGDIQNIPSQITPGFWVWTNLTKECLSIFLVWYFYFRELMWLWLCLIVCQGVLVGVSLHTVTLLWLGLTCFAFFLEVLTLLCLTPPSLSQLLEAGLLPEWVSASWPVSCVQAPPGPPLPRDTYSMASSPPYSCAPDDSDKSLQWFAGHRRGSTADHQPPPLENGTGPDSILSCFPMALSAVLGGKPQLLCHS